MGRRVALAVLGFLASVVGIVMVLGGYWVGALPTLMGWAAIVHASGIVQDIRRRRVGRQTTPAAPLAARSDDELIGHVTADDWDELRELGADTSFRPGPPTPAERKQRAREIASVTDDGEITTTVYADGRKVEEPSGPVMGFGDSEQAAIRNAEARRAVRAVGRSELVDILRVDVPDEGNVCRVEFTDGTTLDVLLH